MLEMIEAEEEFPVNSSYQTNSVGSDLKVLEREEEKKAQEQNQN